MSTNSPAVPVIDISPFFDGTVAGKRAVADAVDEAGRSIGFLVVSGHGVPEATVDAMYSTTRAFFDLEEGVKLASKPYDQQISRGYMPLRSRALSYSRGEASPPDLVEFFAIGQPNVDRSDPYFSPDHAGVHFHENIWPEQPAGFREAWTEYYLAAEQLATSLMRIFALALDLDEHFFDDKVDRHCSNLFANNYPEYDGPIEPGQLRLGAHTDYGSLTIVHQDSGKGGLQVFRDGGWHDVPPVPGAFVVNIGDLMAQWTNDRWVSTLHRVVNPDAGTARGSRRISIPFFHQPNFDALIECLPSCQSADQPPKYAPILSGVNMTAKTNATLSAS